MQNNGMMGEMETASFSKPDFFGFLTNLLERAILPPVCPACDEFIGKTGALCARCWAGVRQIENPICPVTGEPLGYDFENGMMSMAAIARQPDFDCVRSVAIYENAAMRLVQSLKFSDRTDLAPWLAGWMMRFAERTDPSLLAPDLPVVPVPLHKTRLLERRFNQSAELARAFCALSGQDYRPDLLVRVRETFQQVGLGIGERRKNVFGAFQVPKDKRKEVKGKRILLMDDVLTTGATLESCSRPLRRAGAKHIIGLTFARVLQNREADSGDSRETDSFGSR